MTTKTISRPRRGVHVPAQPAPHEAIDALQKALDRRDNGGETGH